MNYPRHSPRARSAFSIVAAAGLLPFAIITPPAPAQTVRPATLIAITGSTLPGSDTHTVYSLNPPFTSGNGQVGFTGTLTTDQPGIHEGFVYSGDHIVWRDSWAPPATPLFGAEPRMGIGDAGQFIYEVVLGDSSHYGVWGQNGLVAVTDQLCQDGSGLYWTSATRPTMLPDGTAHFLGGTNVAPGLITPTATGLWRAPAGGGPYVRVLGTGDIVDGLPVSRVASYWVSDNGAHHIQIIGSGPPLNSRTFVYVDGHLRHERGTPTGSPLGDTWSNLDDVTIENRGHYALAARTNAAPPMNSVIAVDGRIKLRGGDHVPGSPVQLSAFGAVSINNRAQVLCSASGVVVFGYGPLMRTRSLVLLQVGDRLDFDNDGTGEFIIASINRETGVAGLDLAGDGRAQVSVALTPVGGGADRAAIISVQVPPGMRCPSDWNQNGSVQPDDIAAFVQAWFADLSNGTLNSDFDGDEAITPIDISVFVSAWLGAVAGGC